VSRNIAGVNQDSDETGVAAGQVFEAAKALAEQARTMRRSVDTFVTEVRAA
jgi:methyl-accepting chemotaxis protein